MLKRLSLSLFLIITLFASSIAVFASEPTYDNKQLFVDNILSTLYNQQPISVDSQNDVNEVLMKYVSNDIAGALEIISDSSETMIETTATNIDTAYEILENYLNENNVYIYSCETSDVNINNSRSAGSTDIQMNKVIISYNSNNNTWSVTGGGYWITTAYLDDAPTPSVYTGAKNVGGMDAVGFVLLNTSGTLPTLVSSSGYVHDGNGSSLTLTNPSTADSSTGIVFEYQDQVYYSDNLQETLYLGYGFAAQAIYTSNFSEYNGRARSYYAHTWNDCSITSIGIDATGFSASWSHDGYGWNIHNNSDTVF